MRQASSMEFSFVFASGRMVVHGKPLDADHRLYHLDLPRHVGLRASISGTVDGESVSIEMVDVLGALRALHSDKNAFRASGSAAQLAGSLVQSLEAGRSLVRRIATDIERRAFLDRAGRIEQRVGKVRLGYAATAPSRDGTVTKNFATLVEAETWLQRRRAASLLGLAYLRMDELLDDEIAPSLDEFLAIASLYSEAPSIALGDAA